MARSDNYLLGNGERLTARVEIRGGGGVKRPPYAFDLARSRVAERVIRADASFDELPDLACPDDRVVALLTLHPRYVAKSDFPEALLREVGLRAVGSRAREVIPEQWGVADREGDVGLTEDVFVVGSRSSFAQWATTVTDWTGETRAAAELAQVEDLVAYRAPAKLRAIPNHRDEATFEFVLQDAGRQSDLTAFEEYAATFQARVLAAERRVVRGLTFVPVITTPDMAPAVADFSLVRIARAMPQLRDARTILSPTRAIRRVTLPDVPPLTDERVLVFDGGVPDSHPLTRWAAPVDAPGIGAPDPEHLEHGVNVTSATLFGPLPDDGTASQPVAAVDHVRVIDDRTTSHDLGFYKVLDRIVNYLDAHEGEYRFVNISLGEKGALTDDDVSRWTSELDQRFARGHVLVTIAAGNDGDLGEQYGRVQPPADGVNILSVGAATRGDRWVRAPYSCTGPGRSPGLVKPDGLAFGGTEEDEFLVVSADAPDETIGVQGTSFAAPALLRVGVGAHAQLGDAVGPLALRALLLHRAEGRGTASHDHGWGRFLDDPGLLVTCDDDEAVVIYQGELPVGAHLRARVPLPNAPLRGMVTISATMVISPEVDPGFASAYTRSGLEVTFRPHDGKFTPRQGIVAAHADTKSFFSHGRMYGAAEYRMREDGLKWEPCLRQSRRFRAGSLSNPTFDIYYHHRDQLGRDESPQPIGYALIVGIKAPKVPNLYNEVVRTHARILEPLRPRLHLPVRVRP